MAKILPWLETIRKSLEVLSLPLLWNLFENTSNYFQSTQNSLINLSREPENVASHFTQAVGHISSCQTLLLFVEFRSMVMPLLIQLSMFLDHKNSEEEKKRDGDCETKKNWNLWWLQSCWTSYLKILVLITRTAN